MFRGAGGYITKSHIRHSTVYMDIKTQKLNTQNCIWHHYEDELYVYT